MIPALSTIFQSENTDKSGFSIYMRGFGVDNYSSTFCQICELQNRYEITENEAKHSEITLLSALSEKSIDVRSFSSSKQLGLVQVKFRTPVTLYHTEFRLLITQQWS